MSQYLGQAVWNRLRVYNGQRHHKIHQTVCEDSSYIVFLQINLAGELLADLIQCSSAPVSEPVQHTSAVDHYHVPLNRS